MKKILRIFALWGILAIVFWGVLFGVMVFGKWTSVWPEQKEKTIDSGEGTNISNYQKEEEIQILDIRARNNKKGQLLFSISMEEFIDCYNAYYREDNGIDYLQPYSEWYSYVQDFGKHRGAIHYEFTADKKIWTLPTITVFSLEGERTILELTVNFDDHSYSDEMYAQYEEMCFYTLRVFFPNLKKQKIIQLYKDINELAYQNIFPNGQGFHSGNPPSDLYYQNEIGVYPYFAFGESVRLCMIPVTPKLIKAYEKKGTVIHEMK